MRIFISIIAPSLDVIIDIVMHMARRNPSSLFPTDEPLAPDDLIGRQDDVEQLITQLRLRINAVLSAPRRTGKTTVCRAALTRLADHDQIYTASIDLFHIDSLEKLAAVLQTEVLSNRPALRKILHGAAIHGKALYEGLSLVATPKLIGAPELAGLDISLLPRLATATPTEQISYALALPQQIAAADGKRMVLYVDEFQDIARIGDNHATGYSKDLKRMMRSAFQDSPDVSFLFAGSLEHMMRDLFGSPSEPFFQFGGAYQLHEISAEQWAAGLTERFDRDGTTVEPEALRLIIERGALHPRATMLIAQRSHLITVANGSRRLNAAAAAAGYEAALTVERSKHDALLERARHLGSPVINRNTVRVLTTIAVNGRPYSGAKRGIDVARTIAALRDAGIIQRAAAQSWKIVDPLFAEYLRREQA